MFPLAAGASGSRKSGQKRPISARLILLDGGILCQGRVAESADSEGWRYILGEALGRGWDFGEDLALGGKGEAGHERRGEDRLTAGDLRVGQLRIEEC